MIMYKIEHLGIAVKDLEASEKIYALIFQSEPYKRELVESERVMTSFFECGPNKIELLAATEENSTIQTFINKRGEGIHHVAFAVEDIKSEMIRLQNDGFVLLNENPKRGADNKWVCFLHPKHTSGVLIELCQDVKDTEDGF